MQKVIKKVVGTAATLAVDFGFIPDTVSVLNATARTELVYSRLDTVNPNGVAVGADGVKTKAASAAAGIAIVDGSVGKAVTSASTHDGNGTKYSQADGVAAGIELGASATVNANAAVLVITATLADQ